MGLPDYLRLDVQRLFSLSERTRHVEICVEIIRMGPDVWGSFKDMAESFLAAAQSAGKKRR